MTTKAWSALRHGAITACIIAIGVLVFQTAGGGGMNAFVAESAEWCSEHGGVLYNANVIGSHGGLHCDLPNGTSVHMDTVVHRE
jgi:hypothetical protein